MDMGIYLFLFLFFFLIIGIPMVFALGLTILLTVMIWGEIPYAIVFQQMYQGVDSFTLLALPLFMLVGELMSRAGIIDDILFVCNVMVGRLRGGLAHVNIVASMLFAGISGSAAADTAAMGGVLIPAMKKNGYDAEFSVAVTAASSVIGPIIPPSIGMVLYGSILPVSISALFMGGLIPGILIGGALMAVAAILSKKRNYPVSYVRYTPKELARAVLKAVPALLTPVIILGGILAGIFTPTEAAAIANTYALLLGIFYYKTLNLKNIYECFLNSMVLSASVLFIVAAASPIGWLIAMDQIPQKIAELITVFTTNPYVVLLFINIFLLFMGALMEANVNLLIFAPILAPVAASLGIDPHHFAIVFCLNIFIGLCTPPFGICNFIAAGIGKISIERASIAILPFVVAEIVVLLLVTYIPAISLTLPRILGLIR